jgi:hypothetical protein
MQTHNYETKTTTDFISADQGGQKIGKKLPKFEKCCQNCYQMKKNSQTIFIKAQCESPKHVHQTTSKFLKILTKNILPGPLKIAQMMKFRPIWSPCCRPTPLHQFSIFAY